MSAEERIERVQDALQRRFRVAGYGSITRVQKALQLGDGYFKDQRRPGRRRVDLKILFRALEELEVDPSEFFAEALGPADVVASFRSQAAVLEKRIRARPKILKLCKEGSGPDRAGCRSATEAEEHRRLDELDSLRFENPKLAMRRAAALARGVDPRHRPRLLGIYASACRLSGRLDLAQVALAHALDLAGAQGGERGDPKTLGNLLQRASYVAADRGEHEVALALSERATLVFVDAGDLIGIGMTLVDQGTWLCYMGRKRRSERAFRSALESYLPADDERSDVRRNRFCCLMNLGAVLLDLGEIEEARRFARRARDESDGVGASLIGKLVWLQASIAERQERLERAEEHLRTAVEIYRPIAPLDAATAAVELTRIQLRQGKTREVYETAQMMTLFLQPLRKNPIASGALMKLLRTAMAGHGLTLGLIERVSETLRKDDSASAGATVEER